MGHRHNHDQADVSPDVRVPPFRLFLSFFRIGLTAFGGPAIIAHVAELAVTRKKWMDFDTFRNGLALSQSIPGATAMQTAAYVGLRTGGLSGSLAAFVGFGLPAFLFMTLLSSLYSVSRSLPWVVSLFGGLQVIVVAMLAHAAVTFGKSYLKNNMDFFLMAASALALLFKASPFLVVIGAAIAGLCVEREEDQPFSGLGARGLRHRTENIVLPLTAVAVGMGALYVLAPGYFRLALLLMKIDLFAFGGGFASVPLMFEEIVHTQGWMDSRTFMDGIALGQVTPGPIVITATFIGYLQYGLAGAAIATVAIFTPSFVLLVATAPFVDILEKSPRFRKALSGIAASFVGLLFSVSIKFALAVDWDVFRVLLTLAAFFALLKKIDLLYIVLTGAALSVLVL
ncbi:MAG: putative chromate transport protein [Syntrophus sp. PtaU1.Bin208]|nr:MAG: putative chromate transport protein [Syntrophus sp. PtaU1.Bin208]